MKATNIDLSQRLRNQMKPRPRVRGRYNSSELWFINNGYTTPEEWLNAPERKMKSLLLMWNGTGMHNQLEPLLGKEHCEEKKEIIYKDIVLVGKADYQPPEEQNDVWEFKTSARKLKSAKPWHMHQTKLYTSMFNKKRGLIYQPSKDKDSLYLRLLGITERDDKWFETELEKLYIFHKKVEKLWELK